MPVLKNARQHAQRECGNPRNLTEKSTSKTLAFFTGAEDAGVVDLGTIGGEGARDVRTGNQGNVGKERAGIAQE